MIERAAAARRSKPVDVRRDQGRTGLSGVLSQRIRQIQYGRESLSAVDHHPLSAEPRAGN